MAGSRKLTVLEAVAAIARHERAIAKLRQIPGVAEVMAEIDAREQAALDLNPKEKTNAK